MHDQQDGYKASSNNLPVQSYTMHRGQDLYPQPVSPPPPFNPPPSCCRFVITLQPTERSGWFVRHCRHQLRFRFDRPAERPTRPGPAGHRLKAKLDHPPVEAVSFTFITEGWPPACRPTIGSAYNTTTHCYPRGILTARHTAVSVTPPPWFALAHWGGGRGSIPTIRMDRLPPSSCRPRAGRSPSPAQAADRGVFQHRTVDDNVYGWYGGLPGGGR